MRVRLEKEVDAYIASATAGDVNAQKQIAKFYCSKFARLPVTNSTSVQGEYSTPENCSTKGVPILRKLADTGDVEAQLELASLFNGNLAFMSIMPPNDEEAFRWYLMIAQNTPSSLRTTGPVESSYKAIGAGWVAQFYKEGRGVSKNLEAAFKWYQTAASIDNNSRAAMETADMLAKGQGTKPDVIEAERLLKSLGDDDDAQYKLAEIFLFYDVAIPDHYEKAKQLFELLHERGRRRYIRHMSAYYLGLLNYQGWGVQRDYKSAFDYFLEAAKFGEPQAQKFLAILYSTGLGALQSYKDAYMWAAIAAANGNTDAAGIRDAAQKQLSQTELAEGRSEAAKWGKGGNARAYKCKADYNFLNTFTVDRDTLAVRWNGEVSYNLDAKIDGNKIYIRRDSSNEEYVIDSSTNSYTESGGGAPTSLGKCEVVEAGK